MTGTIRRAQCRELDLSAERVWPPARLEVLDGWRCRLDSGVTRRANSVLAAAWRGKDPEQNINRVERTYEESGLSPCFQITPSTQPSGLDGLLADRGYALGGRSFVQRAEPLPGFPEAAPGEDVRVTPRPPPGWRGTLAAGASPAAGLARARILERIALPCAFVALGPAAAPDAIGLGVHDSRAVWINSMYTRPARRGRGLARRLLAALACWAAAQGAEALLLQVEADNLPARRLYRSFGFAKLYPYHYRSVARS